MANEFNFASLTGEMASATMKQVKANKQACKSFRKAKRKMKRALRAKQVTEMRVLIGMARVALDRAEAIAKRSL